MENSRQWLWLASVNRGLYWKDVSIALRTKDGLNQRGLWKGRKLGSSGGLSNWSLWALPRRYSFHQLQSLISPFKVQKLGKLRLVACPSEVARGQGQVTRTWDIITSDTPLWLGLFPKQGNHCELGITLIGVYCMYYYWSYTDNSLQFKWKPEGRHRIFIFFLIVIKNTYHLT